MSTQTAPGAAAESSPHLPPSTPPDGGVTLVVLCALYVLSPELSWTDLISRAPYYMCPNAFLPGN